MSQTRDIERDAKIGYITHSEAQSTAYVDIVPGSRVAHGTDKHTDEPITVRWDDCGKVWREIKP